MHHPGIGHVVVDGLFHLLLAIGRVDGLGGSLRDVAGAIELGTLAAVPQGIQRVALCTVQGDGGQFLGNYGVAAACTCESRSF